MQKNWIFHQNNILQYYFLKSVHAWLSNHVMSKIGILFIYHFGQIMIKTIHECYSIKTSQARQVTVNQLQNRLANKKLFILTVRYVIGIQYSTVQYS